MRIPLTSFAWIRLLVCLLVSGKTVFARSDNFKGNQSLPYDSCIAAYQALDQQFPEARLLEAGPTDCGRPLHLFLIDRSGHFTPLSSGDTRLFVLITNGIHPGEPDGIDASLLLARDLLTLPAFSHLLDRLVIGIVPVFNIDGALRRSCCSRANQDGPAEQGFRGNGQYLDLNRDFMKADANNTRSLIRLFTTWNPAVLIDTHVSDGADYSYTMTLISSAPDKQTPPLGDLTRTVLNPEIYRRMEAIGDTTCPYVDTRHPSGIPDSGIVSFLETPRFMSGWAALHHCIGFITESHMLKPFAQRVNSTYRILESILQTVSGHASEILVSRKQAASHYRAGASYPVNWKTDWTRSSEWMFSGYAARYRTSRVTGLERLYYDRNERYRKPIPFFEHQTGTDSVTLPRYYVLPQAWSRVAEKLLLNGVRMEKLEQDTTMRMNAYRIKSYKTTERAYEGHYLHYDIQTSIGQETIPCYRGDWLIPTDQAAVRLLLEALEPKATDSYFNWGSFDAVLQQKEWFSDYVFEDIAERLLAEDPSLQKRFDDWKAAHPEARDDGFAQLYFIYTASPYYELGHLRYPVYRIE